MSRDDAALLDVLQAARLALAFTQGMDRTAFLRDPKTQSAVLHQLLLLGEAVKRLSEAFREQHPQVPWRMIAGMRDKLIHEYDEVDLHGVWRTLESDLPELIQAILPLTPGRPPTEGG
jgi:uncharacterized protein with HEPN domain